MDKETGTIFRKSFLTTLLAADLIARYKRNRPLPMVLSIAVIFTALLDLFFAIGEYKNGN